MTGIINGYKGLRSVVSIFVCGSYVRYHDLLIIPIASLEGLV